MTFNNLCCGAEIFNAAVGARADENIVNFCIGKFLLRLQVDIS